MISVSVGPFQATLSTLWNILCWPFRLIRKIDILEAHVRAMTDAFYIILADLMENWLPDKRERVLRLTANFTLVNRGLNTIKLQQNPFTADEVQRLRWLY